MKSTFSLQGVAAVLALGVAGASAAASIVVPENLQPPAGQLVVLEAHASGAQVYVCSAAKTGGEKTEWTFKAPQAKLFDGAGKQIGTHYAGPTWELADGGKITGKVKANATPDATAIPWLLLDKATFEGKGVLADVITIQRLQTAGGKAPAEPCAQTDIGKQVDVPYTAVYRFFKAG